MYNVNETEESRIYDFIIMCELATAEEIQLVTNICGWNTEALNNIIWCRSEYHDAEQCKACEPEIYGEIYAAIWGEEEEEEESEINGI